MAVQIRRAVESDMFGVYKLLRGSTLNARGLPLDARRRMFQPLWGGDEGYYGYLMEDGGAAGQGREVIGFLGTLFTTREIGGRREDFCEIHSWYVRDSHRDESLNLLLPVIGMRKRTVVNHTPTQTVYDISARFGFKDLETGVVAFYPIPATLRRPDIAAGGWRVPDRLDAASLKAYADHRDVRCLHVVIDDPMGPPVYALFKTVRRRWFEPFGRLIHTSDPAAFARLAGGVVWRLCLKNRWQAVIANQLVFEGLEVPGVVRKVPREVPSQFRSKTLEAKDLDQLCSQPLLQGYRLH